MKKLRKWLREIFKAGAISSAERAIRLQQLAVLVQVVTFCLLIILLVVLISG